MTAPPTAGSGDAQGPALSLADRDSSDHPGDPVFRAEDHGPFVSQILVTAGIYLLMALGLNIVVGYAGLLDWAMWPSSPSVPTRQRSSPLHSRPLLPRRSRCSLPLPFVMVAAAVAGILVATPVIRMRRLSGHRHSGLWRDSPNPAQLRMAGAHLRRGTGDHEHPRSPDRPLTFSTPQDYFYPVFLFVLLAAYVTFAVQKSRWGRAWMAMREDESVAEAMGVNIVTAKLSAFVVGAILASFGGSLFAAQIGSVFPHTFDIVVSITVLVIIIVGGMGSVPGVTLGALVLIVLLLREFSEYQFLFYGVLLIVMMLKRPGRLHPQQAAGAGAAHRGVVTGRMAGDLRREGPSRASARRGGLMPLLEIKS